MYFWYQILFSGVSFCALGIAAVAGVIWLVKKIRKKRSKAGTAAIVFLCIAAAFFLAFGLSSGKSERPAEELNKETATTAVPATTEVPATTAIPATTVVPETTEAQETTEETVTETDIDIEGAAALVDSCFGSALSEEYGDDYIVESAEDTILVKLWHEDVALNAAYAMLGHQENLEVWDSFVETIRNLSSRMDALLQENGYEDVHLVIMVMNDSNLENYLLMVMSGQVLYDYVNGIDIIGAFMG